MALAVSPETVGRVTSGLPLLAPKPLFWKRRQRGQNTVPDLLDRLKTALADRYAIEHEWAEGKALPKGLKIQPNDHVGKRFDAVMRVFVPYVTV